MSHEHHVNCRFFQENLDLLLQDQLSQDMKRAMEDHLTNCLSCIDLTSSGLGLTSDLSEEILQKTIGSPCGQAESALGLGFSLLEPVEASLLEGHLAHCESCSHMENALDLLHQTLPDLRDMDPGPLFTQQVLRATLPRETGLAKWGRIATGLLARPRFAMELAYVAALLVFLIWKAVGLPQADHLRDKANTASQSLAQVRNGLHEGLSDLSEQASVQWSTAVVASREGCADLVSTVRDAAPLREPTLIKNMSWPPWRRGDQTNVHDGD